MSLRRPLAAVVESRAAEPWAGWGVVCSGRLDCPLRSLHHRLDSGIHVQHDGLPRTEEPSFRHLHTRVVDQIQVTSVGKVELHGGSVRLEREDAHTAAARAQAVDDGDVVRVVGGVTNEVIRQS